MRHLFVWITVLVLLAACSFGTGTLAGCQPSEAQTSSTGFREIRADMKSRGEVWALLFFDTAHANEDEKIVWRITGESDQLDAQAQSEGGTVIQPIWKEYHGGSNWQRPGQEWGTGFNFPEPGCWTITVRRGETTGTISLDVLTYP
jgi:hypothetical protein